MARPALPFNEMTREQQLRRCQYLRAKGEVKKAETLKKKIKPPTKTKPAKPTKTTAAKPTKTTAVKPTKTTAVKPTKTTAVKLTKTTATKTTKTSQKKSSNRQKLKVVHCEKSKNEKHEKEKVQIGNGDDIETSQFVNKTFLDEIESKVGSREVKLIDMKSRKKFIIDPNEGIKEAPTIRSMIKESLYKKSLWTTSNILSIEYSSLLKSTLALLPLIILAVICSTALIVQGQTAYKLMGLPYYNLLAIGMVLTIGTLKFWSVLSKSYIPFLIMIGIMLFEAFVLYSGAKINHESKTSQSESRKAFLTQEVARLDSEVLDGKKEVSVFNSVTDREVNKISDLIERKKAQNVWNYGRRPEIVGVIDLQDKLNEYQSSRALELKKLRTELKISEKTQKLSKYKSEVLTVSDVKTNISDVAMKYLIALVLVLNIYVFHCIGLRFKKEKELKKKKYLGGILKFFKKEIA